MVYGYGNPGRQDDGCGIVFTESVNQWLKTEKIKHVDCDSNYQLNIEDAELISDYDMVIFADASMERIDSFRLSRIEPSDSRIEFSMHAVSPAFVLDLCHRLYGSGPDTYLIHIKGLEWDFGEGLSLEASRNVTQALEWLKPALAQPEKMKELV